MTLISVKKKKEKPDMRDKKLRMPRAVPSEREPTPKRAPKLKPMIEEIIVTIKVRKRRESQVFLGKWFKIGMFSMAFSLSFYSSILLFCRKFCKGEMRIFREKMGSFGEKLGRKRESGLDLVRKSEDFQGFSGGEMPFSGIKRE